MKEGSTADVARQLRNELRDSVVFEAGEQFFQALDLPSGMTIPYGFPMKAAMGYWSVLTCHHDTVIEELHWVDTRQEAEYVETGSIRQIWCEGRLVVDHLPGVRSPLDLRGLRAQAPRGYLMGFCFTRDVMASVRGVRIVRPDERP